MNHQRGPDCPPTRALEAFSAGDAAEVGPHVASCERCSAYVTTVRDEAEAWRKQRPPELFLNQLDSRPTPRASRWSWWPMLAGVGLTAALLAVVFIARPNPADEVLLKGGGLRVSRIVGQTLEALDSGARVKAGDVVLLDYEAPAKGFLWVAQLDGTEAVSTRFEGPIDAGPMRLPAAIEFDSARGPEWFIAIFSRTQLDGASLLEQLKGQSQQPRLELQCGACIVSAVRLEKP